MKYIQEHHDYPNCIFCQAVAEDDDVKNLIIHRGEHVFMILNRFPYTSGHMMCVPYAHVDRLHAMSQAARTEMMESSNKAVDVLQKVYQPEGFNLGLNLGAMAGAGLADHLHMHIVPRWGGDTNFISTIGETRVLPESLNETYDRVKQAWDEFKAE